jgi:type I restriction enzyme S subunit
MGDIMKEKKNIPEIRFEGFVGEWEIRKLEEISDSYSGGTPSVGISEFYNGFIPFIRSAEINKNSTELYITELGLLNSSAKLVDVGNILYALYGATSGEVGRSQVKGAINQAILAIIPKNGFDAEFIMQYLRKKKKEIISTYLQGGQGNLSGAIVKKLNIDLPKYVEQSQIGTFFQNLDQLITLEQQKHNKLVTLKKAMLEKMFPKEGASVPEIRFEGFEGVWPKVILDEIVDLFKGKTLGWKDISDNGIYECILYGNLYTEYGMVINKVYYKTNNYSNELVLSKSGDVLIPSSDTTPTGLARASSIEKDGVILGGDINVLRPSKEINGSFISYNINANRDKLIKYIKGSTVRHLDNSDLKNVELYISKNPKEQSSIVNFFKKIDTLISLQKQKIDKLKNIKKACLDKMFV